LGPCGSPTKSVRVRSGPRGSGRARVVEFSYNQRVMWLRTYLFNHYNIWFLAIFYSSSSSQILDFSLICLPFASDDFMRVYSETNIYFFQV